MEELLPPNQMFPAGDHEALENMLVAVARDFSVLNAWAEHSETTARRFANSVLSTKRRRLLMKLRENAQERPLHG